MKLPASYALGSASHTGRVRVNNEDDYLIGVLGTPSRELLLSAVADGMGGAAGGAEASRTALRALGSAVLDAQSDDALEQRLELGFRHAATRVFEQAQAVPALREMGTTLTALCLQPGRAFVGHIGDTRLYRIRDGEAAALTVDHAVREPDNLLTRCIGGGRSECAPDFLVVDTLVGDRFVLLSDGIWSVLTEAELAGLCSREAPQAVAESLVGAALASGGPDNATAVVVDVLSVTPSDAVHEVELARGERPGARSAWPPPRSLRPPLWPWLALLLALLLLVVAALYWWWGFDLLAWLSQKW